MNVTCPKCSEKFNVERIAGIPDTQRFSMKLTSESELIQADTVGQSIVNLSKLLVAVAKDTGIDVIVFTENVVIQSHEATITLNIVRMKPLDPHKPDQADQPPKPPPLNQSKMNLTTPEDWMMKFGKTEIPDIELAGVKMPGRIVTILTVDEINQIQCDVFKACFQVLEDCGKEYRLAKEVIRRASLNQQPPQNPHPV